MISSSAVDAVLTNQSQGTSTQAIVIMMIGSLFTLAFVASLLTYRKAKKITSKQHLMRRRDLRKERSERMIDEEKIVFDERGTFIIDSNYEKII